MDAMLIGFLAFLLVAAGITAYVSRPLVKGSDRMFGTKEKRVETRTMEEDLRRVVEGAVSAAAREYLSGLQKSLSDVEDLAKLANEKRKLEEKIQKLEIEKEKKEWEFERERMEVEHRLGLLKKQQEWEGQKVREETEISLTRKALETEREVFEEKFEEIEERLVAEIKWMRENLVNVLIQALPKAEMVFTRTEGGAKD